MKSVQPKKSPRERREALLEQKRASSCTSGLPCSIAMTEGELIDLQAIESWLSASDDVCPPDPLGRGMRLRWLKTLAHILDQSNKELSNGPQSNGQPNPGGTP